MHASLHLHLPILVYTEGKHEQWQTVILKGYWRANARDCSPEDMITHQYVTVYLNKELFEQSFRVAQLKTKSMQRVLSSF